MALRFLQANIRKKPKATEAQLKLTCDLQPDNPLPLGDGSVRSDDDEDDAAVCDIIVPHEQAQDEMNLVQEMEMDRQVWLKLFVSSSSDCVTVGCIDRSCGLY